MYKCKTAVTIVLYKRPREARKLIRALRETRPERIYVIADGPRKGEARKCAETRAVTGEITWPCKIYKSYAKNHLGLRRRVVTGLDWVFTHENVTIVLEEDCIPHASFFPFCEAMLEKYKSNEKIISVTGSNFFLGSHHIDESYFFSRYIHTWGWATWKRAWELYDDTMATWPVAKKSGLLHKIFNNKVLELYWTMIFDMTYRGLYDSWGYRWQYSNLAHRKLSVNAGVNLISNRGYTQSATHTMKKDGTLAQKTMTMHFPLVHPLAVAANAKADNVIEWHSYLSLTTAVSLLARNILRLRTYGS